jgi:hypothetical protein
MGYRWSIAYFLPFGASHDSGKPVCRSLTTNSALL